MVNRSTHRRMNGVNERTCPLPASVTRAVATNEASGRLDCKSWRNRLQMLDFALVDLVLYLDAYPQNAQALAYYQALREERESLLLQQPANSACAVTNQSMPDACQWTWTDNPWPWHLEANE